jgi:hypothetical protein
MKIDRILLIYVFLCIHNLLIFTEYLTTCSSVDRFVQSIQLSLQIFISTPVFQIRDVHPRSGFFPSRIPGQKDSGSPIRIRIENSELLSGMFIPDLDFLPIRDPGIKKAPDPEFGSAYWWKRKHTINLANFDTVRKNTAFLSRKLKVYFFNV